jgi:CubicO group peptidase (beta-lactamase class C family)
MPSTPLPRNSPESQGVDRAGLDAFFAAARAIDALHSVMLMRHGAVIAEAWWSPYAPEREHMLFSLSKSFTSTAIGLLVGEGKLTLDDRVLDHVADFAPADPSDNLRAMTIEHLLMMGTGHDTDTLFPIFTNPGDPWAKSFLAHPVLHKPGTHFVYNSGATYMLSVIAQRVSGLRLLDYLRPRLFEPLGITGGRWQQCPQGFNTGGWGLKLKTEDIARFGLLYLQNGMFDGQRVLDPAWVARASRKHIDNNGDGIDWKQGYGYQFWRSQHNGYRGDGAFGQYCVMLPDQDAVVAITSSVDNMQTVLDLIWTHLLPAMGARPQGATPARAPYTPGLLTLPRAAGAPDSPVAARISGRTYVLDEAYWGVQTVRYDVGANGGSISLGYADAAKSPERIDFGHAADVDGTLMFFSRDDSPDQTVGTGGWEDANTHVARIIFAETPFTLTLRARFDGDALALDGTFNRVSELAPRGFALRGRYAG